MLHRAYAFLSASTVSLMRACMRLLANASFTWASSREKSVQSASSAWSSRTRIWTFPSILNQNDSTPDVAYMTRITCILNLHPFFSEKPSSCVWPFQKTKPFGAKKFNFSTFDDVNWIWWILFWAYLVYSVTSFLLWWPPDNEVLLLRPFFVAQEYVDLGLDGADQERFSPGYRHQHLPDGLLGHPYGVLSLRVRRQNVECDFFHSVVDERNKQVLAAAAVGVQMSQIY